MKLTQDTLTILKNYQSINPGIVFKKGNVVQTISPQKVIVSEAEIQGDSFDRDFGIYDLGSLLSILSLAGEEPEIILDEKFLSIIARDGRAKIKYRYTDTSLIVTTPDKKLNLPSKDVTFNLSQDDLTWLLRSTAILQLPHVAIESDGAKVYISAFDANNDAAHEQKLEIQNGNGVKYRLIIRSEYLKLLSTDYSVTASKSGIALFEGVNRKIKYWIAIEKNGSTYGGE